MALFVKRCPCLRPKIEEDVRTLDYRHCSLTDVPGEVFNVERTLEELLVDSNQIQDLPRVSMDANKMSFEKKNMYLAKLNYLELPPETCW